jgi:hypothetical protein
MLESIAQQTVMVEIATMLYRILTGDADGVAGR